MCAVDVRLGHCRCTCCSLDTATQVKDDVSTTLKYRLCHHQLDAGWCTRVAMLPPVSRCQRSSSTCCLSAGGNVVYHTAIYWPCVARALHRHCSVDSLLSHALQHAHGTYYCDEPVQCCEMSHIRLQADERLCHSTSGCRGADLEVNPGTRHATISQAHMPSIVTGVHMRCCQHSATSKAHRCFSAIVVPHCIQAAFVAPALRASLMI
jgi:hypothetical protein